jgi:hypothetical protein
MTEGVVYGSREYEERIGKVIGIIRDVARRYGIHEEDLWMEEAADVEFEGLPIERDALKISVYVRGEWIGSVYYAVSGAGSPGGANSEGHWTRDPERDVIYFHPLKEIEENAEELFAEYVKEEGA